MPFDEGRLWKGEEGPALLASMQEAFRNITRVMDCVGCEKCKLWGKLQTLGECSQSLFCMSVFIIFAFAVAVGVGAYLLLNLQAVGQGAEIG